MIKKLCSKIALILLSYLPFVVYATGGGGGGTPPPASGSSVPFAHPLVIIMISCMILLFINKKK